MKRSEMLEVMESLLGVYKSNLLSEEPAALFTDKVVAHHWLTILEKKGMLPPFCDKLYNPHTDFNTGNEWEPEEE